MPYQSTSTSQGGYCTLWSTDGTGNGTFGQPGCIVHSDSIPTSTKRRKPTGFLLPTPYERTITRYRRDYGYCDYYQDGVKRSRYSGYVGGGSSGSRFNSLNSWNDTLTWSGFPADLSNTALIEARNSLKGMSVNLAQAFAEREQTARLVTDSANDIYQLYRAIRKLDTRKGLHIIQKYRRLSKGQKQRFNKTVASSLSPTEKWLQVQYGWKPLMSDVYGGLEALSNNRVEDCYFTAHGTAKRNYLVQDKWTGYGTGRCEGWASCKYTLIGLPRNSPQGVFSRSGISNPALLAWELTPFSFVWDWFHPVGDFISSWDALLDFRDLHSCKSERVKLLWNTVGTSYYRNNGRYFNDNKYEGFKSLNSLKRTVQSGVPMPTVPGFRNPVTMTRMANAISLLFQIFGKGSPLK